MSIDARKTYGSASGRVLRLRAVLVAVALVGVDVRGEVSLAVSQRHVRLALGLVEVQRLVQVLVHEVVLRALLAGDVAVRWHAD